PLAPPLSAPRREPVAGRLRRLGARGRSRWTAASDNLRGSALMIGSILVFCVMMSAIKAIGDGLPLVETLLIRQLLLTAMVLPVLRGDLVAVFRSQHAGLLALRGLFSLGSQYTYFLAVLYLPLAEMTALGFSQVVFMTLTAVVVLRETVDARRWAATGIGFLGVLVMLKPGAALFDPHALLAILSALLLCGVTAFIRLLADRESTSAMLLYQSAVLCLAYVGPAIWLWEWPTPREWGLLALIGVFGTIGQYLFTMAFRVAETSALAPLEFTRLIVACAIGYALFDEIPDLRTLLGATIVIATTVYTVRGNAG
ncbi:DMT family transporter, partial [Oharaeibacter diazotrophicus]